MKRKTQYSFARVPSVNIGRSVFDRSFTYKTTFNAGYLVPVSEPLEVLPGDTWNLNLTSFARLATPVCPFMDNLWMDFFFFFVPNRLAWPYWSQVMGEEYEPLDESYEGVSEEVPFLKVGSSSASTITSNSLADYFGLPVGITGISFSALPFFGYNLIYNEHFADENLIGDHSKPFVDYLRLQQQGEETDPLELTYSESTDFCKLKKRGKRHDYFTSCLPWPQKGPGVEIPLGGSAPVVGNGIGIGLTNGTNTFGISGSNGTYKEVKSCIAAYGLDVGDSFPSSAGPTSSVAGLTTDPDKSGLIADLSGVSAATINTWRQAFQIQLWEETSARSGTRYPEIIEGHFGVRNPDARLQRTEYLGGGTVPVNIHSVAQTSSTDATSPQGNLAALGVSSGRVGFSKSFTEHGYIFCLASVRADLTYQQGIARHWSRKTKFDFYWPEFAHLGEQAVLNKEIYAQGTIADDEVFGYQERWAEYRYGRSMITGKLRSGIIGSLDVWHLAQNFSSLPTLSQDFIEENPPIDRVVAVQNEPHFLYDSVVNVKCVRPMPTYSVPGFIDHRAF